MHSKAAGLHAHLGSPGPGLEERGQVLSESLLLPLVLGLLLQVVQQLDDHQLVLVDL